MDVCKSASAAHSTRRLPLGLPLLHAEFSGGGNWPALLHGGVSTVYVCVCLCVCMCVHADLNRDESSSLLPFVSVNKPVHFQNHTDCDIHVHSVCVYGCVCVCVMTGGWEGSTTLLHQGYFLDRRLLSTVAAPQLPAKVTFSPGYKADT